MGSISYLRKKDIRPLDWMATIDNMNPTEHICKSKARVQSPDHPDVYIILDYKKGPTIYFAGGQSRQLDAIELSRFLLEWGQ